MRFGSPTFESGNPELFTCHFADGWSSPDYDGDSSADNCAAHYGVTQHYCNCWDENLGSDADAPLDDGGWGPHLAGARAAELGLASDGTAYTRVNRILRWTRW